LEYLALITGYAAVLVIVLAGLIPAFVRLRDKRRAAPDSGITKVHVGLGIAAAGCTFLHTLGALPALGSPAAAEAGNLALFPAALAFLIVTAHVGVGLQLKEPRLKDRVSKRKIHLTTALLIVLSVSAHVFLLRRVR
jgi:hypothetical protein